MKIYKRLSASGAWPRDSGTRGVRGVSPRITKGYIFRRPVSSLDSYQLSRCLISIKRRVHNKIYLTVARATQCTAIRNCCAAFSYELRGRAAAQLRGNIAWQDPKFCENSFYTANSCYLWSQSYV